MKISEIAPDANGCFMQIRLTMKDGAKRYVHENTHFFDRYKSCELSASNVKRSIKKKGSVFQIHLQATKPAFFTTAEVSGVAGIFDDNSFTLMPGVGEKLTFYPRKAGVTLAKIKNGFRVKHLRETY